MSVRRALRLASALAVMGPLCTGCGILGELDDPLGRHSSLTDCQRKYTQALRWGEIEEASTFVDPDLRGAFLEKAAAFESYRITDYETGQLDYAADDSDSASVAVTYRGYNTASLIEKPIRERQQWYRKSGNDWRVRPSFDPPIGPIEN